MILQKMQAAIVVLRYEDLGLWDGIGDVWRMLDSGTTWDYWAHPRAWAADG
jgi:hypothetical protein